MTAFILGGGPTGLAIADALAEVGMRFVLLERATTLGGLAQTLEWRDVGRHDLGPHKMFSLDRALVARVERLLPPDAWLTREKSSRIFIKGHFLPYPPSPFSLRGVFGTPAFARMAAGYLRAMIGHAARQPEAATFEQDLVDRVGRPLYDALFGPIAWKLWGDPSTLDAKLSRGRVQTPRVGEILRQMTGRRRTSTFEALTFRYPRGGLQRLWTAIETKAAPHGEFKTRRAVTEIVVEAGAVSSLTVSDLDTRRIERLPVGRSDFVVSTLPLTHIPALMPAIASSALADDIRRTIQVNDLLLVFLHFDVDSLLDESWTFVPDGEVIFHRVSEQESFDPSMTPSGTIVCCEVMSGPERPLGGCTDEALIAAAVEGLRRMGYTQHPRNARVIRLPQSYPVFRSGFLPVLESILASLDGLANFRSLGRQGAFNYIGTLDAMDIGYGFARWLTSTPRPSWTAERLRTGHYPVLD